MLADNRLAMNAGWDEEMLRVELESLKEDDFDLDIVGFTDEEIEALLATGRDARGTDRRRCGPEEQETRSRSPAMCGFWASTACCAATPRRWTLCEKVMAGGLADMVFSDPPYNVDYEGKTAKKLKIGNDNLGGSSMSSCATPARTCWR